MINLPGEIIQQIRMFGDINDLGVMQVNTEDFNILIIGTKEFNINQISILAAYVLLGGIVNGELEDVNDMAAMAEGKESLN